ncbi:MAG: hypothetical protein ACPGUD_03805 [Parashewanella sp.]
MEKGWFKSKPTYNLQDFQSLVRSDSTTLIDKAIAAALWMKEADAMAMLVDAALKQPQSDMIKHLLTAAIRIG